MKNIVGIIVCALSLGILSSCDDSGPYGIENIMPIHVQLHYTTDMIQQEYPVVTSNNEVRASSIVPSGEMRYIIRLYPQDIKSGDTGYSYEYVFTRDVCDGYDTGITLNVPSGDYKVAVWSDLTENTGEEHRFYCADDFAKITLQGVHEGNNDYRDAFCGFANKVITRCISEKNPDTCRIEMERPLAKFEFVATDVAAFVDKQVKAAMARGEASTTEESLSKAYDLNQYKVVFYYNGFMPNVFNMFSDKPADSATGIQFDGKLSRLSDGEVSLGFDYVFVNGVESAVTVQIGIYDKHGNQLSMSAPVSVPLRRGRHTIMKGSYLTQDMTGGVGVNPTYDGDYNIMF